MSADHARPIAVLGAGTLGRRIALMFSSRGGVVRIFDSSADQRTAAKEWITARQPRLLESVPNSSAAQVETVDELAAAVADAWLVVESLPENLDIKRPIFTRLGELAPGDAILATNSSSYPSSTLAGSIASPGRLLNLHFFMPPGIRACEIMSCGQTDPGVIDRLTEVLPSYGLDPFVARKESLGFIYNRIWAAIKREALAVAAEGVATPEEIDRLFVSVLATQAGPFRMMDAVGLDVVLDIEEHYAAAREGIPTEPRELLRQYIEKGHLGRKTKRGFYDY
jgi:3-hydroxybutyryl-CoA dehydrogenase